jgi:alpha-methylacyl-CoA racemase
MGPLDGITIVELAGLGPAPFCGMMLADMGATVIRVDRPGTIPTVSLDPLARNRQSLACDLKDPDGIAAVLRLVATADGLIEGFRPGVMERLGLGPDECLERNPKLAYGRMTGWGQDGPLADAAGHDINYISLSGALHLVGESGRKPIPPLNLVGDFGGGGMLLAFGMVSAILSARTTGKGQVIDAAMIDGANIQMAMTHGFRAMGMQPDERGASILGGAAHFYDAYETADGKYISIAAIEPQFYDLLIEKADLDRKRFAPHVFKYKVDDDVRANWRQLKSELTDVFKTKTREQWCQIMEGTDICFSPVLTLDEAPGHPHNKARRTFVEVGGNIQPSPAPRFGNTAAAPPTPGVAPGTHSRDILLQAGFSSAEIDALIESGAIAESE